MLDKGERERTMCLLQKMHRFYVRRQHIQDRRARQQRKAREDSNVHRYMLCIAKEGTFARALKMNYFMFCFILIGAKIFFYQLQIFLNCLNSKFLIRWDYFQKLISANPQIRNTKMRTASDPLAV